jgi:uncharacterized protein (DUF2141 family)
MKYVFALALALFVACAPQSNNQLEVKLEPLTQQVGKRNLALAITRDGKGLEGASVNVEGTMTHAGMGVVRATAVECDPGVYCVNAFDFNMSGDWILTVTAKAGGETLTGEVRLGVKE